MKIKFLLIASIFMISSGYSQEKWSLKKCVDYALENNISIKQSALSISLSEKDVAITQGNFLPTIGAGWSRKSLINHCNMSLYSKFKIKF